MSFLFQIIFILFSTLGLVIAFFLIAKPALAIEIQKKFYAKINWKIEPISVPGEFRNTRIMGGFLVIFLTVALVFLLFKKPSLFK